MRILILGGYGHTGVLLARHLLERTAAELVLAGRSQGRAQQLAGELNAAFPGERVCARQVDAADGPALRRALDGVDLLLVAAPTTQYAAIVVQAALDAGVDYLDVQLDAGKLAVLRARASEIEQAGRCFITEAGFHPGLPAAMVRYAAAQLDTLETAVVGGFLNMGRSMPYSEAVDELMEVFRHYQGQVYTDGGWTSPAAYRTRTIDFGPAIGARQCVSMYFEELGDLPRLLPGLREVGFYMAGSHWLTDWVVTPLVMVGLKIPSRRLTRRLGKITWWSMQHFARPPYVVALQVEATGTRAGQPARVVAALGHPDGYELTAIPVVACLQQVLDGVVRQPGLWLMGQLVEPVRLFDDMAAMGVEVRVTLDGARVAAG